MSNLSACCFSYAHFRDLVRQICALDFAFVSFGASQRLNRRMLLWRQDTDLHMFKAVAMARIEPMYRAGNPLCVTSPSHP
jgi:hypothetical protein